MAFDSEYDPDDWDLRDRELAAEPLLAVIEKRLDHLIEQIGADLPRPADQGAVIMQYKKFRHAGWTVDVRPFCSAYFDLAFGHKEHGTLFRQCWVGDLSKGPCGCGSVYNLASRCTGWDFRPDIEPGHHAAVEKWLGEITTFIKMGLHAPTGRKVRSR